MTKKNKGQRSSFAKGRGPKQKLLFCDIHQVLYPKWSGHICSGERVETRIGLKGRKKKRNA